MKKILYLAFIIIAGGILIGHSSHKIYQAYLPIEKIESYTGKPVLTETWEYKINNNIDSYELNIKLKDNDSSFILKSLPDYHFAIKDKIDASDNITVWAIHDWYENFFEPEMVGHGNRLIVQQISNEKDIIVKYDDIKTDKTKNLTKPYIELGIGTVILLLGLFNMIWVFKKK